jgi:drug/metabolite transporter (DMT)-like permease
MSIRRFAALRAGAAFPHRLSIESRAGIALATAALLWSGNFIAGRALRGDIDPATLTFVRWSISLLIFLPWVGPRAWRCRQAIRREWRWLLVLGATGLAGFHTLTYLALTSTTAINAMLMLSLTPTAILAGTAIGGSGRPTRQQWVGTCVSLAGAAILVTRGDPDVLLAMGAARGDLWMLVAVVLWAVYSLALRRRPPDLPTDVSLAASIVPAVLLLIPWVALGAPAQTVELTPRVLALLAYIIVMASLVSFLLWSWGVGHIGPERAGPFVHLLPVFGAVLAVALLDETVVLAQLAGAAAVFAGMVLVQRRPRRR